MGAIYLIHSNRCFGECHFLVVEASLFILEMYHSFSDTTLCLVLTLILI